MPSSSSKKPTDPGTSVSRTLVSPSSSLHTPRRPWTRKRRNRSGSGVAAGACRKCAAGSSISHRRHNSFNFRRTPIIGLHMGSNLIKDMGPRTRENNTIFRGPSATGTVYEEVSGIHHAPRLSDNLRRARGSVATLFIQGHWPFASGTPAHDADRAGSGGTHGAGETCG